MMEDENLSSLIQKYEQMLALGKNLYFDADEYTELADYYEKLDDVDTAKKIVDLGIKVHPDNTDLLLRYARFLIYSGNYTLALEFLNSRFSGYDFELYLLKIECLLHLGLYAEAYELTADVVADEDTDSDVSLSELGFIYIEADYYNEAILYFEKSLEYNSENLEVLYDLVYAYETIEDFQSAIKTCERILDVDPYVLEGWLALGRLYSLDKKYDEAINAFEFALTLDDSNASVMKLKAHCLLLSDRFSEGVEVLKQCVEMSPDDPLPYSTLIDCYMDQDQSEEMLRVISDYESRFGNTADLTIKKAYALFLKGRYDEVEKLIETIGTFDLDSYYLNSLVGDLYFKMEQYECALRFYLKSLSLYDVDDDDEVILGKLVTTCIRLDDFINAIRYQKKIVEKYNSEMAQAKLALLYLEIGDRDSFDSYVNLFSDQALVSFFHIFNPEENIDIAIVGRDYVLNRLASAYESRLLYKNIRY